MNRERREVWMTALMDAFDSGLERSISRGSSDAMSAFHGVQELRDETLKKLDTEADETKRDGLYERLRVLNDVLHRIRVRAGIGEPSGRLRGR